MKKEKQPLEWTYEIEYKNKGVVMCGTDEAGRGPLAGRVYAAAVVLDEKFKDDPVFKALDDSKKLTEKKRFEIANVIYIVFIFSIKLIPAMVSLNIRATELRLIMPLSPLSALATNTASHSCIRGVRRGTKGYALSF